MSSSEQIHPIPAFSDNYIWVFANEEGKACVVDPGDPAPVAEYLDHHNLTLSHILLTHHHPDHTGGVTALAKRFDLQVIGPANSPFSPIDQAVKENDRVTVLDFQFQVLEVPGHTLDHVAYYCENAPDGAGPLVFCGDTLFAAGCGRIFEGNPVMMYQSLQKLACLPSATRVYCTHEYTMSNLQFANAAEPQNSALQERISAAREKRERNQPTLPSTINLELATNPFLRCSEQPLIQSASRQSGDPISDPIEVFATLRHWKDNF